MSDYFRSLSLLLSILSGVSHKKASEGCIESRSPALRFLRCLRCFEAGIDC